ncbi:helix-turn-helix domain-containing protein [Micromonospora sp. NBC_01699]|uniref:ArsR/SmtB family transcription factor n=1 Tax=Micromonospora sp. NBC_01699 TaxID=2975984 RepID=UPI002E2B0F08|nr:helix-turn-helix domain-containing protein [Micromonospora sp. NBC_01699]
MSEERAEPRWTTVSDPRVMRALAHPARIAIMEHLGSTGRAVTATECAEVVELSPSATSYHLRELARFGLVEQAPSRGDARERLWRAVQPSFRVDGGQGASPDTRAAEWSLVEAFAARDFERLRDWVRRSYDEPKQWYDAAIISGTVLLLTAEELTRLNAAVLELVEPYRRRNRQTEAPAEARPVALNYSTLPLE